MDLMLFLEGLADGLEDGNKYLTKDVIAQAICERIFYDEDDLKRLIHQNGKSNRNSAGVADETRRVIYLTDCYKRCYTLKTNGSFQGVKKSSTSVNDDIINDASLQIIQNLSTIFKEPEMMAGFGDPKEQLFGFFNDGNNESGVVGNLLQDLVAELQGDWV